METVATELIERTEKSHKAFVQNPQLSPWVEHPRWTLGPVKLKGQHGFDFMADGKGSMDGIRVIWGSPKEGTTPRSRRFKVFIESKPLWRHYVNGGNAYTAATETLEWITGDLWGGVPVETAISVPRLDVCIDHKGYRWTKHDLERFACHNRVDGVEEENAPDHVNCIGDPASATYTIGGRGQASRFVRIYQKVKEAMKHGKMPWMQPIWERELSWDGVEDIWRIEIEFGSQWLKKHGVTDLSKLRSCEANVWRDYLKDVRHTTGTRARLKNSPTSRVWQCLRAAVRRASTDRNFVALAFKPRAPRSDGDMKQLAAMLGGCGKKIKKAMFADPSKKDELLAFIAEAIADSESRERDRLAKLSRHNPPPPPRPRREAS